jgi:uncharacterized protein
MQVLKMKNSWPAKIYRTLTCLLPVSEDRHGECVRCGNCCKLPNRCFALRYDEEGKSYCKIYRFRPLNCRKYPRTQKELVTQESCGYKFSKPAQVNTKQ